MKIATIVKGYITSPAPPDVIYAPINLAIAITTGLVNRGHSVDYFAPEGSKLSEGKIVTCNLQPIVHNTSEYTAALLNPDLHSDNVLATWDDDMSRQMFVRADRGEYDILFFHHPEVALPYVSLFPNVPVVHVMHDPIKPLQYEILQRNLTPNQHFVSLSNKQRETAPKLPYIATVYNGIDTEAFNLSDQPRDDYLLFMGRVTPDKGAREAVQVALKSSRRLLIVGSVFKDHQAYFDEFVKPFLGKQIQYLGHIEHDKLAPYIQKATALLMPIQWEEPFGLTMTESMACGTPIIALRRGSVPEVVVDGQTGFIVDSIDGMVKAVEKVAAIDPKVCRQNVLDNFSTAKMVDAYEAVFKTVLDQVKSH